MNNDGMGIPMNTREAIVVNRTSRLPILDMDPATLETTTARDVALPESDAVMALWDSVVEAEIAVGHFTVPMSIVWSDDRTPVRFLCPLCDDVCDLDDGTIEDLPDNTCAMVCPDCLD